MPGTHLADLLDDCLSTSAEVIEQYEVMLATVGEMAARRHLRRFASESRRRHDVLEELSVLLGHQPTVAWPHPLITPGDAVSEVARWRQWERLWALEARMSQRTEAIKAVGKALSRPDLVDVAAGLMPAASERVSRLAAWTREAAAEAFGPEGSQRQAG